MPITPTKRLLSDRDAARPNLISKTLLSGAVSDEDCPWVEIGNLYVSVTIVGERSWLPLVSLLYKTPDSLRYDHKKYVVFTGRHGDVPNVVDETGKTLGVFDKGHFQEDEKIRATALIEFPGITVELVDAGQGEKLQAEWLRKEISRQIFARKTVICAWCYGLFSMCEAPADANKVVLQKKGDLGQKFTAQPVMESHNEALIGKTVGDLVQTYWNWVPRSIM